MNEYLKVIFGLIGGLAVFLYGMNMMSDSLQKAAGEKMKKVLGAMTKNPILGVLSGALVTAVLQSSSATTVMAIGFVSAGLMTLPQAISIIFGANIGTTMTAQLIAFKISDYIYPIIFIGFIISFVTKKEKVKYIGDTIFSFGLLFLGIETMGSVMKPLASSPFFVNMIGKVAHIPPLGLLVGMCMTLVVQSSSATIAVLQNFAAQAVPGTTQSIIGLAGAIPVLLGDNIGTTITAVLASLGQSRDAKRTAAAHCIFNISGSLIFIWFVKPYAHLIKAISPKGDEIAVISRQIANAHTGFNLTMTIVWTILIGLMVKIVMKLIPMTEAEIARKSGPRYLDPASVHQPALALHLVCQEILHCSEIAKEMLLTLADVTSEKTGEVLAVLKEKAGREKSLVQQINDYVAQVFSAGTLTEEQASQATGVLFVLNDVDRISENTEILAQQMADSEAEGGKMKLSKKAVNSIRSAASNMAELYERLIDSMVSGESIGEERLREDRQTLLAQDADLRKDHMKRVAKGECDARKTAAYNNMITAIGRIGNACVNIAEFSERQVDFRALLKGPKDAIEDAELETVQEDGKEKQA